MILEPVLRQTSGPAPTVRVSPGACSRPVPSIVPGGSIVAQGSVPRVSVFQDATGHSPLRTLANPQPSGAPLVFLVIEGAPGFFKVLLPVRPNGSTGYVRQSDVTTFRHDYRIVVELNDHCLTTFKGADVFLREPVGIGRKNTPTPGGSYYIKELYQPPKPNTTYGPYAYGLSGFSDALSRFQGGDAVIGIHGNNNPLSVGKDLSAGCIRMSNPGITRLSKELPLGVPVEIRP